MTGVYGSVPFLGEVSSEAMVMAERRAGVRCTKCGQRLQRTDPEDVTAPSGFHFVKFALVQHPTEGPTIRTKHAYACVGIGGCDFAVTAAAESAAVEPVFWQFLNDDPMERVLAQRAAQMLGKEAGGEHSD